MGVALFANLTPEEEDLIYDFSPTEISLSIPLCDSTDHYAQRNFLKDIQHWKLKVAKSYLQRARARLEFAKSQISRLALSDTTEIASSYELSCLLRNCGGDLHKSTVEALWVWNCRVAGNPFYDLNRSMIAMMEELQYYYPRSETSGKPGHGAARSDKLRSLVQFLHTYDSPTAGKVILTGSCHSAVQSYISALRHVDWLLSIVTSLPIL